MKKTKKSSHAGMTHVDHDMFTNKDGFKNGGVEVEVSKDLNLLAKKTVAE